MRNALALLLALVLLAGCKTAKPTAVGPDGHLEPLPPGADALARAADPPADQGGPGEPPPAQPAADTTRPDASGGGPAGAGTTQPGPGPAPPPATANSPADHPGVLAGPRDRCFAGSSTEPEPPYIAVYLSSSSMSYSDPEYFILDPGCRVVVGGDKVAVEVVAPEGADPDLLAAAVQAAAGGPVPDRWITRAGRTVEIEFPDPAVREMSVSVAGPLQPGGTPAALGVFLVRDYPEVIAELRQGSGAWQWLDPLKTYPDVPTELRLRFSRPIDPSWLPAQYTRVESGVEWKWTDPLTFTVTLADPPPLYTLDPNGATDARRMSVWSAPVVLHTGEPPALMAFDPATGQTEPVAPAPPEAYDALLSPDGRYLAVSTWFPAAGAWDGWQETVVVVDMQSGSMHVTPLSGWTGWGDNGDLVGADFSSTVQIWNCRTRTERRLPLTTELWQGWVSPDGSLLAAYDLLWDQESQDWLLPAELVVVDLRTGEERRYANWTRYYVTHSEYGVPFPVVWDGNGAVVALDYAGADQWTWIRLDLATGRREPMQAEQTEGLALTGVQNAPGGWGYRHHSWESVTAPLPDGGTADLGPGLAAGRAPDGRFLFIRWPEHAHRYMADFY